MLGPLLVGERVTLAPITEEMLPTFVRWFADPDVTRFLTLHYPPTLEGEGNWLKKICESPNDVVWATLIAEAEEDATPQGLPKTKPHTRVIGTTGIHGINWASRRGGTGNLIGEKSEWGKGYATEAVALRTRWAFEHMGLHKLSTQVFMENVGSRRVLEKAGYKQYGIARQHEWWGGKYQDMWLADVLADEWFAAQELKEK